MDDFANSFDSVDQVYVADIYPARETDDLGISGKTLAIRIGEKAEYISGFENIANEINSTLMEGDALVVMGAGDIYKLFDKEEIAGLDIPDIKKKTDEAILFDAYREQEKYLSKFKKNDNIEGLHNVLYMCPHCKNEFSIHVKDKSTLYCDICGYEETSDKYGFLHNEKGIGAEIRYPADWSRLIYEELKTKIADGSEEELSCDTIIHTIDFDKNRYVETGKGVLTLNKERFALKGEVNGEELDIAVPVSYLASLPFKPGRHLELQHGNQIYRCVLSDGRLTMKYINTLKIHNELNYAKINSR
jgi:hypothetical protein